MVSQKKQAKRLKKNAQQLWSDQQELLDRANALAKDAIPQAQQFARSAVGPGARTLLDERVRPAVDKGAKAGKAAGSYIQSTTKDALTGTLVPALSSSAAAALALLNEAGDRLGLDGTIGAEARKTLDKTTRKGHRSERKARAKLKAAAKVGGVAAKVGSRKVAKATGRKQSGPGVGGVIGLVLGVAVVGGVAYAIWQTLRADDDLWVADEDPETTPTSDAPTA